MKKKSVVIGLGIIVLFLLCFAGYKVFLLNYYKYTEIQEVEKSLDKITSIEIKTNKNLQNQSAGDMYLYVPDMDYNSTLLKDNSYVFSEGIEEEHPIVTMTISKNMPTIKYTIKDDNRFKNDNYQKLLEKNKIADEIDLLEYYTKYHRNKSNIFWSSSHIKMDYLARKFVFYSLLSSTESYFLTNDLKGYMTRNPNNKYYFIMLVHDKKVYTISLWASDGNEGYFTKERVLQILESISFK